MATRKCNIFVRSARSAVRPARPAPKYLNLPRSDPFDPPPGETDPNYWYKKLNKLARQSRETYIRKDLRDQLIEKTRREFALSDDIVNSEEKLHALFLKWLSSQDYYHFDVEDKAAFKERFDIFKAKARFCNDHKEESGNSIGINCYADLTSQEFRTRSWKKYPKKADQVITGVF